MPDINLYMNDDKLEIKDLDLEENKSIGWISKSWIGIWINFLKEVKNNHFDIEERPEVNPEHITLYNQDNIIGWVDKNYKKDITKLLQRYLHDKSIVANISEKKKKQVDKQLSLFN
ncbi:MAG: hypothetical protein ACOCP8_08430 [archaeon]